MSHWSIAHIGKPWIKGTHECGHFFCALMLERFALSVALIDADALDLRSCIRALSGNHPEFANWTPIAEPREGDCIRLSHSRHPHHVGMWVDADGGGVLHCVEGAGVIFSNRRALRVAGWNIVTMLRHKAIA